jgi:ABC-2 type transport system ATP-binding protein
VRKSFGDVRALRGVDLTVEQGTVLGLLGPNGAGKTTLVRILTTLLHPDAGSAMVCGYDVVRQAESVRRIIGLSGQYAAVDENLTGFENLSMVGQLYHLGRKQARARARELLESFSLQEAGDRQVKTYSGGMRRRLDLAASLVTSPPILFLDEPTTGLDPRSRIQMWDVIRELVRAGTTLLLTTQYLEEADALADQIAVIDRGQIIAQGTADELKDQTGGSVLELHISEPSRTEDVAHRLVDAGQITIHGIDGPQALTQAVRVLDELDVHIADLALRRPSLDEVFLAITGEEAADEEAPEASEAQKQTISEGAEQ